MLFGPRSPMRLSTALLDELLHSYDYQSEAQHELASQELAKLAELFSEVGGTDRKYINGKATQPSQTETEIWVKPAALMHWLNLARGCKMNAMRLCMHGSDLTGYNLIKADPIGFSIKSQGKNGTVHGWGTYIGFSEHTYIGFSEHVTQYYNNKSGEKPGTALLCLLLTDETLEGNVNQFTTFKLCAPPGMDSELLNAAVVREGALLLILGKVKAL